MSTLWVHMANATMTVKRRQSVYDRLPHFVAGVVLLWAVAMLMVG